MQEGTHMVSISIKKEKPSHSTLPPVDTAVTSRVSGFPFLHIYLRTLVPVSRTQGFSDYMCIVGYTRCTNTKPHHV